jgi:hypothetical protein
MTKVRKIANQPPCMGKVPSDIAATFFLARLPAIARTGKITPNLPTSMQSEKI